MFVPYRVSDLYSLWQNAWNKTFGIKKLCLGCIVLFCILFLFPVLLRRFQHTRGRNLSTRLMCVFKLQETQHFDFLIETLSKQQSRTKSSEAAFWNLLYDFRLPVQKFKCASIKLPLKSLQLQFVVVLPARLLRATSVKIGTMQLE